ncbi:sirohydrochlorin chelatase [Neobacillus drentensis]|uniref:sirohydrochlorin chelatase n=1 Tax=Neobacillus drentensis TaxID=220684 RepID=UPI0030028088
MKAILYIGHGTRSKKGAEEAISFIQRVMVRINVPIQEVSFLELTHPFIEEGFRRCVERGATEVTVVPLFLLAAGHIKEDIPNIIFALRENYPHIPIKVKDPFGVQRILLDGIAELVRDTVSDLSSNDTILIVGRGSSDSSIHDAFTEISFGIRQRLGVERVSVCFLAAAEPRLDEGLENICNGAAGRVIVVPYLLFSGLLLNEVNQKVRKWQNRGQQIVHTGQLSKHRVIEDIVIQRAIE